MQSNPGTKLPGNAVGAFADFYIFSDSQPAHAAAGTSRRSLIENPPITQKKSPGCHRMIAYASIGVTAP